MQVFALFDDVMVLSAGHLVYHGPISGAEQHFQALGYKRPVDMDTAEFLQQVRLFPSYGRLTTGALRDSYWPMTSGGAPGWQEVFDARSD